MDRKTHFWDGVLCSDVASTIVFLSFILDKLAASLVYSFYPSKYKYYTRNMNLYFNSKIIDDYDDANLMILALAIGFLKNL